MNGYADGLNTDLAGDETSPPRDPVADAIREAEAIMFPAVPEDHVWCALRGVRVGISECASSCAAPEQRPVCWLGRFYAEEGGDG